MKSGFPTFEPVRQVEEVAVFGFEPFDGPQPLSGGRTSRGRAALSCDEVLCRKGRKIARKAFERGAPHAGKEVDDEREGDDGQCEAAHT